MEKKSKAGRKNRSTLVDGQVSKHTAGSIRIDQHRLRMEKERGGPDKYSDLMEEKYGADRECHPRVGDREIWERACGGPCKKGRFRQLLCSSVECCIFRRARLILYVENLKGQLAEQEKAAQEQERVAKELQQAAEEQERAAKQRVKELEEQVKDIANMLKTLKPPPSSPPS
ncbi:hypothetical protein Tco_0412503 [Tanacetum coccineum]